MVNLRLGEVCTHIFNLSFWVLRILSLTSFFFIPLISPQFNFVGHSMCATYFQNSSFFWFYLGLLGPKVNSVFSPLPQPSVPNHHSSSSPSPVCQLKHRQSGVIQVAAQDARVLYDRQPSIALCFFNHELFFFHVVMFIMDSEPWNWEYPMTKTGMSCLFVFYGLPSKISLLREGAPARMFSRCFYFDLWRKISSAFGHT